MAAEKRPGLLPAGRYLQRLINRRSGSGINDAAQGVSNRNRNLWVIQYKNGRHWTTSHRDLHGFERIFFPTATISALKYIQYFGGLRLHLRRKIFPSKLRSTPKREIFLQDKIKNHGKADACRGFLMQYCGKRSVWERINPYVRPPLPPCGRVRKIVIAFSRGRL